MPYVLVFDVIVEQVLSDEAEEVVVAEVHDVFVFCSITQQPRHITNQIVVGLTRFFVDNEE